jgi:acetoin utilization deacetylase AcuC-like enzyme
MIVFYNNKMVNNDDSMSFSYSKSPLKPKLVVDSILESSYSNNVILRYDFSPLKKEDFYLAHTEDYVNAFFNGEKPLCETSNIPWSERLKESVTYTSGSLYASIEHAINNKNSFILSPTSGFHHAQPHNGLGFCTFSGQVVASIKIWEKYNKRGAYIDLDGHYGNSIDDTTSFQELTSKAISHNLNVFGKDIDYCNDLRKKLNMVYESVRKGETDYVVWCHGADSHEMDDLVGDDAVNTDCWLECSRIFYEKIKKWRNEGYNVPVISTLFGGYRKDNYEFVIWLHSQDLQRGIKVLEINNA